MKPLNPWTLFRVWCHMVPLVMAAKSPDPSPAPDPLPVPQPVPGPEPEVMSTEAVPALMAWLGSIGGVLGIISFTDTYLRKLIHLGIRKSDEKKAEAFDGKAFEEKHSSDRKYKAGINQAGDPPYVVAVQVGLDGTGLKVKQFLFLLTSQGHDGIKIKHSNTNIHYYRTRFKIGLILLLSLGSFGRISSDLLVERSWPADRLQRPKHSDCQHDVSQISRLHRR